ncbi:MAG: chemotaxis protein CheW [Spirochaetaceae bacterium]
MSDEQSTRQYLTFTLDEEQYAAEVARVREVLELMQVTRLPRMPEYMKGVINIRGSVVPVVDLRQKFGMSEVAETVDTSIIVMDVGRGEEQMTVGCLADSVEEVIDIAPESVEPAPSFGTKVETEFIDGIAKRDDAFIIILDINRVFADGELKSLETAHA